MDEKSLEVLEFPKVREILAGFASFYLSRELALRATPLTDADAIGRSLRLTAEARRILSLAPDTSVGEMADIRQTVALAAREKVLDLPTLAAIRSAVSALNRIRRSLMALKAEAPLLAELAERMAPLGRVENEIGRCIEPSGELSPTASPRLAALREEIRNARQHLLGRLERLMKMLHAHGLLQEPLVTERAGRYVLPVKTEFQSRVKGIIHDVSNTGATVFIEPWTIVEMGNALRQLALEEEREIHRILAYLSAEVGAHEAEILEDLSLAAEIDFALARGRFARAFRAAEPHILSGKPHEPPVLKLVEACHPLLKGNAVPLTIELGKDFSALVITGPNTGGKTVTLKTIGLLVLMAQSGFPIPASDESTICLFDSVFADIGDEQSIEQTLSTFSSHMGNIVRIIRRSSPRSLVLLDEIAASTDPAEGAALARAILLHFLNARTLVAVTTHYSELKAFAHATPGLENASLLFDPVTLRPTYRLVIGVPGGSNALEIAAQLGLPEPIIASARKMLSGGTSEMEELLKGLVQERESARRLRAEAEKERDAAAALRARIEAELKELGEQKERWLAEAREAVSREMASLHREIREASAALKKERTRQSVQAAKAAMEAVRERLTEGSPKKGGKEAPGPSSPIAVGDAVRVMDTHLRGTVLSLSEKSGFVEIQAGRTRIRASIEDIEKEGPSSPAPERSPVSIEKEAHRRQSIELDLRGKRADEIEPELDSYLNDVSLAGFPQVRIIHGYGTGTVRQIVRAMLASHPLVKSFRPGEVGEGGDGVTIVEL